MSSLRLILTFLLFATGAARARADHTEQRYYSILVDGKETGQARLTIVEQDDGSAYVTANASANVRGLISYTFQIDGQEWWKDGKLVGLKSFCNHNGKKCDILVVQEGMNLRVRVNGADRAAAKDLWASSFWKLADAKFHNKTVPVLAVDNGEEKVGKLEYVGAERLPVANLPVSCYRFRITGAGNPIDLWFDQHHRLVRQEFTQSGHRTIVQLISRR
jgi:hypothetical protein